MISNAQLNLDKIILNIIRKRRALKNHNFIKILF